MADAIDLRRDPSPEVRRYFSEKGLRPAFSWLDVWGDEHAHAFTVAKAMEIDVLTTIQGSLQDAIDDGVPFEAWARDLTPELQRLGWWGQGPMTDPDTGETRLVQLGSPRRLETIYQANMRTARAAGQWERAQRTSAGLPYFLYGLSTAENRRPEHEAKVGTILPVDHPFWDQWFPPNGWGCKCWVRQITRREAERLGGVSLEPPTIDTRPFINRRTGEVTHIPIGIDPGWHTNPGKARERNVASFLAGRLEEADEELRRIAIADIAGGAMMDALVAGRFSDDVRLPIAGLVDRQVALFLSARTVRAASELALSPRDWAALAEQVGRATTQLDGDGNRIVRLVYAGRPITVRVVERDGVFEIDQLSF